MSRSTAEAPSHFPHWVALGSLVFVLWLFFSNTVPALREQHELRALGGELQKLRTDYDAAIQEARLGLGPNAHYDLQALLVAIDQKNMTPLDLCTLWPEQPRTPSASDPGDEPRDPNHDPAPADAVSR
jgi:hypothetical protein